MKNCFLILFFELLSLAMAAQISHTLPSEATAFYQSSIKKFPGHVANFIEESASSLDKRHINYDSLFGAITNRKEFRNYSPGDCRNISLLILISCASKAESDLKRRVMQLQSKDQSDQKFESTEKLVQRKSDLAEMVSVQMKNH